LRNPILICCFSLIPLIVQGYKAVLMEWARLKFRCGLYFGNIVNVILNYLFITEFGFFRAWHRGWHLVHLLCYGRFHACRMKKSFIPFLKASLWRK
jgi:hypothetical protein